MYVTRPLSLYKQFPSALSLSPPEGRNSGILVIQDEESEATCFFGLFKSHEIRDLPFPKNKNLKLRYATRNGEHQHVYHFFATFVPVLNQPLSSNRYYAVKTRGSHRGEAYANSKEEDMGSCFCFSFVRDVPPKPLDPNDVYQQFKIHPESKIFQRGGFVAKSVSPNGFPPKFLGRRGWEVHTSTPRDFKLCDDALGVDTALRGRLPDFNFPLSHKSCQPVVVGKWYSPFMFIREGRDLEDIMSRSMYYEITLEQRWEPMFACERDNESQGNGVAVDAVVQREVVSVAGREAADVNVVDGWEEGRVGWVGGKEKHVTLKRVEEFGGKGEWRKFGYYVLVERFVVKRMDGSLVLTYDFKHIKQSRWE
ncbi:uncharacterized protein LOC132178416 [Corylus avellana]|uniref:uncharacterized protein LOC132178416 n=1 Tax=Corylus avellana TaxID=13451 RepID=UPI00286AD8AC|nr:uncharacterized protein LOC132178416 [Corylus avellana]